MTLEQTVLFLKRFGIGVAVLLLLAGINLVSLIFLGDVLRAIVATVIWVFIIYCIGNLVLAELTK